MTPSTPGAIEHPEELPQHRKEPEHYREHRGNNLYADTRIGENERDVASLELPAQEYATQRQS